MMVSKHNPAIPTYLKRTAIGKEVFVEQNFGVYYVCKSKTQKNRNGESLLNGLGNQKVLKINDIQELGNF